MFERFDAPADAAGSPVAGAGAVGPLRDVVAALARAGERPAADRFERELALAERHGLDPGIARTLRWWHRAAVEETAAHLSAVLPAALGALVQADRAAGDDVERSHRAWELARGLSDPDDPAGLPPAGSGEQAPGPAAAVTEIPQVRVLRQGDGGAPSRRTLVAGLTVLGGGDDVG